MPAPKLRLPVHRINPILRISIVQAAVLLVLLLVLWVGSQGGTQDGAPVLSALWGGLIALVSQGWAAWRLQRGGPGRTPQQTARDGYAAEVGKFALAAAGFGAVFALVRPLSPGMVFAAFGLLTAVHLLGTWRVLRMMTGEDNQGQ